jgi:hypothetical protein
MLINPLRFKSERRESNPHGCLYHPTPPKGAASTFPPLSVWCSVFARYETGAATPVRSPIQGHHQAPSQIGLDSRRTGPSVRRRHLSTLGHHLDFQIERHLDLKLVYKGLAYGPSHVRQPVHNLALPVGSKRYLWWISGLSQ